MNKPISEMTTDEILRQQLELLAERSHGCVNEELPGISKIMLDIACYLSPSDLSVL